jgi:hypothetical protein
MGHTYPLLLHDHLHGVALYIHHEFVLFHVYFNEFSILKLHLNLQLKWPELHRHTAPSEY